MTVATEETLKPVTPVCVVVDEDIGSDYADGDDLNTGSEMAPTVRRPERTEWITLLVSAAITCRLYPHRKDARGYQTDYYFIAPSLRAVVAADLRPFKIVPFYSWLHKRTFLWPTSITEPGVSGWSDSLAVVLNKPAEWQSEHAVRICANKAAARYDIRAKTVPGKVTWPTGQTGDWLGTALGVNSFVTDPGHPIYVQLLDGQPVM